VARAALLEENESRPSRQRLTIIRIYEELVALGYAGSCAAVRRYVLAWRGKRASAMADGPGTSAAAIRGYS
jgi:hypothetical protein